MSFDNVSESSKVCNICGIDKPIDQFFDRRCKECQYAINKQYSKEYYKIHRQRLIELNKLNYKLKNGHRKKIGRPRIYNIEEEPVKHG